MTAIPELPVSAAGAGALAAGPPHAAGAPAATAPGASPRAPPPRAYHIDWLRAALTALVVVHHVAWCTARPPHEGDVAFPLWHEVDAEAEWGFAVFARMFLVGNQSWFMTAFFYIAGLFVPGSCDRKGLRRYAADRALRLLVPTVLYSCFGPPACLAIVKAAPGAGAQLPPSFQTSSNVFVWYWRMLGFFPIPMGPVWFTMLLFWFDLAYVTGRAFTDACRMRAARARGGAKPGTAAGVHAAEAVSDGAGGARSVALGDKAALPTACKGADAPPFSVLATMAGGTAIATTMFVAAYGIRALPGMTMGMWTTTPLFRFMPAYVLVYALAFVLGIVAAAERTDALRRVPARVGYASLALGAVLYCLLPCLILLTHPSKSGRLRNLAVFTLWEQVFACAWTAGLLVTLRERANVRPGRVGAIVIGAAYATYIMHPMVVTGLMAGFGAIPGMSWAARALAMAPLAVLASWAMGAALKAIPGASRVL